MCVKKLLVASGYNKFIALSEIGEEELVKIETHINTERQLVNSLKCCYSDIYKAQDVFHFLPGHKATILGIKNQINQLKEYRMQNPKMDKSKRRLKRNRSAEEVKNVLLKSLQDYLDKNKIPKDILTARNIINFEESVENDHKTYRCDFTCMFCSKVIPVLFNTFWMHSNATKHIKGHIDAGNFTIAEEDIEIEYLDEAV